MKYTVEINCYDDFVRQLREFQNIYDSVISYLSVDEIESVLNDLNHYLPEGLPPSDALTDVGTWMTYLGYDSVEQIKNRKLSK